MGQCKGCKGTGNCPKCRGNGKIYDGILGAALTSGKTCPKCKGSCNCTVCKGSGKTK